MICKKCNSENADGAVYCANCGKRLDGKKPCPACGQFNDEGNTFCNFCGARLDGKNVCESCGAVYEGNFCSKCGGHKTAPVACTASSKGRETAAKVFRIIHPCLIFTAILVLLAFSFCIGLKTTVEVAGRTEELGSQSVFYYLFDCWKEIKAMLVELEAQTKLYPEAYFAYYGPFVLIAAAMGANIIVCIVYGILSAVKFAGNIGKKDIALTKYLLPPVLSTFAALLVSKMFGSIDADAAGIGAAIRFSMNGAAVAEIITVSVLCVAAIVFACLLDGRQILARLKKIVPFGISVVLITVAACTLGATFLSMTETTNGQAATVKMGFAVAFMTFLVASGITGEPTAEMKTLTAVSFAEYFVYIALIVVIVFMLYFALKVILFDSKNGGDTLIFGVFSVVAAAAFLILAVIMKATLLKEASGSEIQAMTNSFSAAVGAGPIVSLIFSVMALTAAFVGMSLSKNSVLPPEGTQSGSLAGSTENAETSVPVQNEVSPVSEEKAQSGETPTI